MEYHRQSSGQSTLGEHCWLLALVIPAMVASRIHAFFAGLAGWPWILTHAGAVLISVAGAALIFHAKRPLYRQRRFFTFGGRAMAAQRRAAYRAGYGCVVFGIALLLCLMLSNP